jgi:hypothetical protein
VVDTSELFAPLPTVGRLAVRKGGQATVQAPAHALFVPTSALNRYRVRPWESTRIFPRLLFATPTVAARPLDVFGGDDDAVAPPPPHAARASAPGNTSAIEVRKVMRLLAVMLAPVVEVSAIVAATSDY